jgi:hypothetical protein
MPSEIRPTAFAGTWYPAKAADCEREIAAFISGEAFSPLRTRRPVGGIVPHAGWYYSGSLACRVIHYLGQTGSPAPDVIVVFGMHLHRDSASVMMPKGAWQTPFGPIAVAEEVADELSRRFPFDIETPRRFSPDNTIELQLPFIKYFFPEARLLAVGVAPSPDATAIGEAVIEIGRRQGLALKVIGSTDLTHYGASYGLTHQGSGSRALAWVKQENDRRVIEAMMELNPGRVITEALENQNACCPGAAAAAISAGKSLGAVAAESIGYATSHDRSPGESFVGYVGIVF